MDTLINQMAELTGMRQISIDSIISELGSMIPKPGVFWIIAAIILFLIVTCQNIYIDGQQNRDSDAKKD